MARTGTPISATRGAAATVSGDTLLDVTSSDAPATASSGSKTARIPWTSLIIVSGIRVVWSTFFCVSVDWVCAPHPCLQPSNQIFGQALEAAYSLANTPKRYGGPMASRATTAKMLPRASSASRARSSATTSRSAGAKATRKAMSSAQCFPRRSLSAKRAFGPCIRCRSPKAINPSLS